MKVLVVMMPTAVFCLLAMEDGHIILTARQATLTWLLHLFFLEQDLLSKELLCSFLMLCQLLLLVILGHLLGGGVRRVVLQLVNSSLQLNHEIVAG